MYKRLYIKFDKLDVVRVPGAQFTSIHYHIGNKKYEKIVAEYSSSYKRRLKEILKHYKESRRRQQ